MAGRASDWFATSAEFGQVCLDAVSLAKGEAAETFAHEMAEKANQYGLNTYVSDKQCAWLCRIADREQPKKIEKHDPSAAERQDPELYRVPEKKAQAKRPASGADFDDDIPF